MRADKDKLGGAFSEAKSPIIVDVSGDTNLDIDLDKYKSGSR
jgi:hypothetical protein